MIEDIVQIRPETRKNYHTEKLEFATPVTSPKQKAQHFFQWGMIHHAKGKPAEAYKYYEKAINHHKNPLYIKQMGLLHHEMGYFKDALKYLRLALAIEKQILNENATREKHLEKPNYTAHLPISYSEKSYSGQIPSYSMDLTK